MIGLALVFIAGLIAGQFLPLAVRGWAWGAYERVRGFVAGKRGSAPADAPPKPSKPPATVTKLYSFVGGPFGVSWKLWAILALAAAILGALYFFGEWREAQGVSAERARWERRVEVLRQEAARTSEEEAAKHQRRVNRLEARLAAAQQALEDVPDDAPALDFLLTWAAADASLRDGSPR